MEQQREAYNLIMIFVLTIASVHDVSSSNQNLYTTTIDARATDDIVTDHVWLEPLNTTTSIYEDSTTYLPTSQSVQAEETNVRKRYARPHYPDNEYSREDDYSEGPPDYVIPYSEHEEARDVPTQPKYTAPGIWAKPSEKNISLDFVPTKLHAQVRGKHTVKRLPKQQAIENAKTDEEKHNALRLRQVVTNSKVNTVYTEEGYEDAAYDHAGHIRDADFHEGFARKLHDHLKKNKKKGKNKKLVPDEFKEYDEDYQDHLQESRKVEKTDDDDDDDDNLVGYSRSNWEEPQTDPKFVAQKNIQKLQEDVEEDAEEAERSSRMYQNAQESKIRNDIKDDSSELEDDSSESENDHVEDELKHENKTITTKEGKSVQQDERNDTVSKGTNQSSKLERKNEHDSENYETTVLPLKKVSSTDAETPANLHGGIVGSSPNSQIYSVDQTTLRYIAPITSSFRQDGEPTTSSYGQLFWDYFKTKQGSPSTTEPSVFIPNLTTTNPQQEEQAPIAVATIDGHGPYLLVAKEETMKSTFLDPQNQFSDHVEFGPVASQTHSRHLLGQSDGVDYVNNVITTSTVATFTSMQPLPTLNSDGMVEYSTTLLDAVSSSTPAVMTLNFTEEAYTQITDYNENPFLGPVVDNSNITVTKNKNKYKVLARAKPSHKKKPVTQSSRHQVSPSAYKDDDEYKKIRDNLNAQYNKMLNYIKNKQKTQSFPKEKKIVFPEDFTLRRPPVQQAVYSIFLTNHPSGNRSSVSAESESSRPINWRNLLQNQHRPQLAKSPFHFDPFGHVQTPVRPVYRTNSLPTTILSPPPPPPPLTSTYANYQGNKQNDNRHHFLGSKPRHENTYRHLNPEANWRTRSRRKRSDDGEFHDGAGGSNGAAVDVKAAANNGVTNDDKSEEQDKSPFDRVIDRSEQKSASRRAIDAPVDVPVAMKLTFLAKSGGNESEISSGKNSTIARPILIQSTRQNRQINDVNVVELATKKRDVANKTYSARKSKKKVKDKNHEELLNESSKIIGDVIDKEIAARFNEDNETSSKVKKIEVEVPSFDYVEELAEDELMKPSTTTEAVIDLKKYPFYDNEGVPSASALKYIVDPRTVPRKTSRGMEFYDSRNAYKQCDEVEPNLEEVLPEKEEPDPERGPQEGLPRLRGLGNKLDCFKAKYFDENPLDNPLFAEKLVEDPTPPTELDPGEFASKIMILPEENDEYVVPGISKKPERSGRQWRNRIRPHDSFESIRVNYKHDPQTGRGRNAYFHTVRGMRPPNVMRRVKNRKSRPWISITTSSPTRLYQTASYQNQIYEDVMGHIRNMKNTYQVYEVTTLPPSTQIQAAAGSENILNVAENTSNSTKEKSTSTPDVSDVTNNTKSSEIKGLLPPPKYSAQRQNYRKHRPLDKTRVSLIRSTTLPRIIAHHHSIKIKKRSTTNDIARNSSESTINENKKANDSVSVDAGGNDVFLMEMIKFIEESMNKTNTTSEPLDLKIEESRLIGVKDQSLSTTEKTDEDKKKRRHTANDDLRSASQKTVYTIRDRIRYSKPKWGTRGFGKFTTSSKTVDEDSRRKEPRYNRFERKKQPVGNRQGNSAIMNSTEDTSGIESATSLLEDRESGTTEIYQAEESAVQQTIYRKNHRYPESGKAENIDTETEGSSLEEDEEESTTNAYQVRENNDENVSTAKSSEAALNLQKYLESDPPGYAEAFPEEATTPSGTYRENVNHESENSEEKQEKETAQDDDFDEPSSKEEEGLNKDKTFFTYTKRPSAESDRDDERFEKTTYYRPSSFLRYRRRKKKKENKEIEPEEESVEQSEEHVFPWHADEKNKGDRYRWLNEFDRYEYPWERRERLSAERRRKGRPLRKRHFGDEDGEESTRQERPIYPWERYDVPSKNPDPKVKANSRRNISRRYIDDSEESSTERAPRYSSRYSSSDAKSPKFSSAREISRSIERFLENDDESKGIASKEIENRAPPFARKLTAPSDRGISRGTLVPEDITQPPRRGNARRKIPQVDRNVSNNLRFDSKKLGEDVINEGSNLDEPESPTEITSSQSSKLSNRTKVVPSATEQRKKRRRRISKSNSTISLGNTESIINKKRRRKPESSTTTSATSSAGIDFDPRKSAFTPVRKRYSKKNEMTNRSDFSEKTAAAKAIVTPETIGVDDFQIDTSTPKIRTVEHRSRVSKEQIVTKTTYPDTEDFDSTKTNLTAQKEPVRLSTTSRRRENNNKRNSNNKDSDSKRESIKRKDKKGEYKVKSVNENGTKRSVILDKPQDESGGDAFGRFAMNKEEVRKINDFGAYDGIVDDENDSDNVGFGTSSEMYAVRNMMQNVPPNQERNRSNEGMESEPNRITEKWNHQYNDEEASEEDWRPSLQARFIKDPQRRMYYYVEQKK